MYEPVRLGLDPADVASVPPEALAGLLAALAALQGAVAARLLTQLGTPETNCHSELLTADQAGKRLGLNRQQVYRRADRWPFTRRLGPKTLRFEARALDLYLARSGKP